MDRVFEPVWFVVRCIRAYLVHRRRRVGIRTGSTQRSYVRQLGEAEGNYQATPGPGGWFLIRNTGLSVILVSWKRG